MYLFILIFFYHDCIFINFYSNAAHKFPVYGTIKLYCIVLYCIVILVKDEHLHKVYAGADGIEGYVIEMHSVTQNWPKMIFEGKG